MAVQSSTTRPGRRAPRPRPGTPAFGVRYRYRGRDAFLTAALAVGALIVVQFAQAFVRLLGNAVAYDPTAYSSGFLASPIGLFLGAVVLYPFPFYAVAFVALTFLFPIIRQSPLSIILMRAVAAGGAGTVALALVGIATGLVKAQSTSNSIYVVLYVLFIPLAAGVVMTAVLAAAAALAWLWLGRQGPLTAEEEREAERAAAVERQRVLDDEAAARASSPDPVGEALRMQGATFPAPLGLPTPTMSPPSLTSPSTPSPTLPAKQALPMSLFEPPADTDERDGAERDRDTRDADEQKRD